MLALIAPTFPETSVHAWRSPETRGYKELCASARPSDRERREGPHARHSLVREGRAAPVHRVPPELLIHIFLLVRDSTRTTSWIGLTHVCRPWRTVALGTPLLWTTIPADKGLPYLRASLERSSDVLVDVISQRASISVDALLDTMRPHAHRLRTLKFPARSCDTVEKLITDIVAPAARLQDLALQVHTPSHNYALPQLALPEREWTGLRTLQLKGIALPGHASSMTNLTSLILSDVVAGARGALESLMDQLYDCRCLRHLSISDNCPSPLRDDDTQGTIRGRSISLPMLETLKLSAHASVVSEILASVSVPAHTRTDVKCVLDPRQTSHNLISAILRRGPCNWESFARARSLYLFVASNIFRVRALDAGAKLLDMDIECNPPMDMSYLLPDALCDLTQVFGCAPVRELQVFGDQRLISQDDWLESLMRLPGLEALEVGSRGQADALFQALSLSSSTPRMCPRLRKMSVGGADVDEQAADVLLTCLDSRAAHDLRLDVLAMRKRAGRAPLTACTVQSILTTVGVFDYR